MRQALTFLAIIQVDARGMKTLAVISPTISGAADTDRRFMGERQTTHGAE